jgi:putative hydrolase of the HAD superfamily
MPTGFQAVVFDFFGTMTVATQRGLGHERAAKALGCDPAAFNTMLDRTYSARATGRYGDAHTSMERIAKHLGGTPTRAQVAEATSLRTTAIRDDIRLRPDAVRTLWTLRRSGVRTALVSDCPHEVPELISSLPISAMLDTTVFSVHLGVIKPHPALFLTACRRLGVHPRRCLYVGDGGGRELSGASAVGMTAVRLAAPDLVNHLVFDRDRDWTGASVGSLSAVVELALGAGSARLAG